MQFHVMDGLGPLQFTCQKLMQMLQKFAEEMKARDASEVWEIISVIYILGITGSLTFLVFPWNVVGKVGVWENYIGWSAWIRMLVESVAADTDGKLITD